MIRLTNFLTKNNVWINPDHIVDTGTGTVNGLDGTYVSTVVDVDPDGMPLYVTESPSEVARKVMEYRMTIEKYRIGLELEKPHLWEKQRKKMLHLAGLEEQKDE